MMSHVTQIDGWMHTCPLRAGGGLIGGLGRVGIGGSPRPPWPAGGSPTASNGSAAANWLAATSSERTRRTQFFICREWGWLAAIATLPTRPRDNRCGRKPTQFRRPTEGWLHRSLSGQPPYPSEVLGRAPCRDLAAPRLTSRCCKAPALGGGRDGPSAVDVMAARLSPGVAVRHPTRAAILEVVQAAPGHGFCELARKLGIAPGTLRHHLSVLTRSDLVRLESVGARLAILPAGERRSPAAVALLRDPELAALRDFVACHGRVHQRQISTAFPAPRTTTHHRLRRLTEVCALRAQRQGRVLFYEAAHV